VAGRFQPGQARSAAGSSAGLLPLRRLTPQETAAVDKHVVLKTPAVSLVLPSGKLRDELPTAEQVGQAEPDQDDAYPFRARAQRGPMRTNRRLAPPYPLSLPCPGDIQLTDATNIALND
jgi:hypothetical protein